MARPQLPDQSAAAPSSGTLSPGPGGRGSDCIAGTVVLLLFFRLRRGRLRFHSLLRAVPLAFGASDFSILFSGLPGANRRRRFLPRCRVPAISWNGPCPLCGPLLTDLQFVGRRPHAMWCLQSQVRAHRTPRCWRRAVPGTMSFCPASIAALRPVDRRLAVPAHVTPLHALEALELMRRERGSPRR